MTTKHYKAVFLDWDDTIGDWTHAEHLALQDIYANFHLQEFYPTFADYKAAYMTYNLQLWDLYGQGKVTKDYLHYQRFAQPKEEFAHQMGEQFLQLTNKYFALLPNADQVVRYLAAKYPLTIISNGFKEVQYYKFQHSGLQDCFKHTIISEEVGVNKPQPGIFQLALELNHLQHDEVIMIGDSYTSDIAGAKAAEIDQIWIHNEPTDQTATFIVPNLIDVMNIL